MTSATGISNHTDLGPRTIELRPRDLVTIVVATAAVAITATIAAVTIADDDPAVEHSAPTATAEATTVGLADVSTPELAAAYSREPVTTWNHRQYVAETTALTALELAAAHSRAPVTKWNHRQYVAETTALTALELAAAHSRAPVTK